MSSRTRTRDLVDRSGTITTGAAAQDAAPANPARQYVMVQNIEDDGGEALWVNFGADAGVGAPGSIMLRAGGGSISFEGARAAICPAGRVSVTGATTGNSFTCKEI
jgi:hypothetical protein